jgi:uncharacterized protein (TIGR01244 family)
MKSRIGMIVLALAIGSDLAAQQPATPPVPVALDTTGLFLAKQARVGSDLFIAGQPTERAIREMKAAGVTVVVNLRMPEEMARVNFDEKALVESLGMKYVHIPMRSPYLPEYLTKFADVMKTANGKVLLHCTVAWRASHLYAAYLIREKGVAENVALEHARSINLMDDHRMSGDAMQPVEEFLGRKLAGIKR